MKVSCDSCGASCDIAVEGPTLLKRALPKGWRPRRIDGRVYILCDVCGNLRQFVGGLSPYLQARLGLPPNVEIEFPEYTELPDRAGTEKRHAGRNGVPGQTRKRTP
jgi:hypothetical protein